ncbi:ATP-binding/permease protein CydC [Candidatus Moranella endobia PCVAL]|uniref:heme ABC transporter ATP-binding protein/permease CydC n=1 Tax=Candidatus Moranella endobia TaxID=1048758 RepID=UPI0002C6D332|nr:cysteine/glutathione ABC transporter ATP-binding protein/permease CydC [Candidatus Moranella endobia]AGJ61321.1 ATP-binding/permease protein CydC [Candidatus Moranella endobia PCVAL]
MRALMPYLKLYRCYGGQLVLGIMLTIVTLLASISLLTLSGWFITSAATVGTAAGLYSFNYMLPAAGVRSAAITRTAGRWAERVVSHDATFRILQHLRLYIFRSIMPLSPGSIARFRQAELLNSLVVDVDMLDHLYLRVIAPLAGAVVVTFTVTTGICLLDLRSGLTLGAVLLAIISIFPLLFYLIGKPTGAALTALRADYRLLLNTWLSSNAELTLYGAAEHYRYQLDAIEQLWQEHQRRHSSLVASAQSMLLLLAGLTLTLVLWLANELQRSFIALFVFATLTAFEALGPVVSAFQYLGQVIAAAKNLNLVLHQSPEVLFPTAGPAPAAHVALSVMRVRFQYPEQVVPAINNLSLTVAVGEQIAILGHTGSGKSTLLQLLTRAWDPQAGEITINGVLLHKWSERALREMTAVVPQRVHIFSATLRANLRLAAQDADANANDEQLCAVMQQLGLDTLLMGDGLNTWLGEGGRALSGGEQRRIGIARALLHSAPLLLLDETNEGLDLFTAQQIRHLLTTRGKERTVIIVTHHLLGLEHFDRIYIIDRGTVIEQGSHQSLMEQRGRYYQYHQIVH